MKQEFYTPEEIDQLRIQATIAKEAATAALKASGHPGVHPRVLAFQARCMTVDAVANRFQRLIDDGQFDVLNTVIRTINLNGMAPDKIDAISRIIKVPGACWGLFANRVAELKTKEEM